MYSASKNQEVLNRIWQRNAGHYYSIIKEHT